MKKILAAALAAACSAAGAQAAPDLIQSAEPFTPEGVVSMDGGGSPLSPRPLKTERGQLNGVPYHFYYSDGSGAIAGTPGNKAEPLDKAGPNWSVACRKDPIKDTKSCALKFRDLTVIVLPKGGYVVGVGADHFPGSSIAIRIDSGKPFETKEGSFSQKSSAAIVGALKQAKAVTTRFVRWPSQAPVDSQWEPYGAAEAVAYATWAVERMR